MPVRSKVATELLLENETRTLQALLANRKGRHAYAIGIIVDVFPNSPGLKASLLMRACDNQKGTPRHVVVTIAEALHRAAATLLDRAAMTNEGDRT